MALPSVTYFARSLLAFIVIGGLGCLTVGIILGRHRHWRPVALLAGFPTLGLYLDVVVTSVIRRPDSVTPEHLLGVSLVFIFLAAIYVYPASLFLMLSGAAAGRPTSERTPTLPVGWYPDFEDESLRRFWDGSDFSITERWDGRSWHHVDEKV